MESLFYMQNDADMEPNMPPVPEEDEFPADEENGNNTDETGEKRNHHSLYPIFRFLKQALMVPGPLLLRYSQNQSFRATIV